MSTLLGGEGSVTVQNCNSTVSESFRRYCVHPATTHWPSTLKAMDELTRRVLNAFIEMGSDSLDLHTLFEAGGNNPQAREEVLDVINRLVDTGHLESRSGDYYWLTEKGRKAAREQ